MESITYRENSLRGRLTCSVFGHKFHTTKVVTDYFKEFECSVCYMQLTNDVSGRRISLTAEHREINETLLNFYRRRHAHFTL